MAESIVIVCDICGTAPATTVRITAEGRNYAKDLCERHLEELLRGTHAPRRGRPRVSGTASPAAAPARRAGQQKTAPAQPKRRGRPPKVAPAAAVTSGRKRGPITDPVLLQKRRDALAKARAARAAKRAAAK